MVLSLNFFSVRGNAWEIDSTGTAYYIYDGDTLNVTSVGIIRLADIDAPESYEPGYDEATNYLSSLVYNKEVYVDEDNKTGVDPYGRMVAVIYVYHNDTHLKNVNKAILTAGHAEIWDFDNNEFNPYDWTLYVAYQSEPEPDPDPDPDPDPEPLVLPDLKDRGPSYSRFNPYQVSPGSSYFDICCDIENIGNSSSGDFRVYFYASSDSTISTSDYFIRSDRIPSIEVDSYGNSDCSFIFPSDIPDGSYFIGWIIDPLDSIDELDEENNDTYITSQQLLVDGTSPISSLSFTHKGGSNKIDKSTTFLLSAFDNLGSGVSSIWYKIDSGSWIEYIEGFSLRNYDMGKHTISFFSIDNLNNTEEIREITVNKIDLSNAEVSQISVNLSIVLIAIILEISVSVLIYKKFTVLAIFKRKYKNYNLPFTSNESKIKRLKENLRKVLFKDTIKKEKMIERGKIDKIDGIEVSVVSNLLHRYSGNIIAIYGIGSYFDDSLPPNWVKNDLDIIVIVKSLEEIPKQSWTEIRYEKIKVSGNHVWLGFNTIDALQDKNKFSNESFSNYGWNLLDMKHPENSKLLYGENIQDKILETTNMLFDYDDILARGLYHLEKSLKEQDPRRVMNECSKGIFKIAFYFCVYFDPSFRSTTVIEIGRKLQQLSTERNFIKSLVDFFEDAIIFRITGQFKTEIKELRASLITYIFSLLDQGALHKKMNYKELVKYLTDSFSGLPYLIQVLKKFYLPKH
ncbi:MAG: thermonuclease family protein [Candidatus Lokiarchaeia archaeon]